MTLKHIPKVITPDEHNKPLNIPDASWHVNNMHGIGMFGFNNTSTYMHNKDNTVRWGVHDHHAVLTVSGDQRLFTSAVATQLSHGVNLLNITPDHIAISYKPTGGVLHNVFRADDDCTEMKYSNVNVFRADSTKTAVNYNGHDMLWIGGLEVNLRRLNRHGDSKSLVHASTSTVELGGAVNDTHYTAVRSVDGTTTFANAEFLNRSIPINDRRSSAGVEVKNNGDVAITARSRKIMETTDLSFTIYGHDYTDPLSTFSDRFEMLKSQDSTVELASPNRGSFVLLDGDAESGQLGYDVNGVSVFWSTGMTRLNRPNSLTDTDHMMLVGNETNVTMHGVSGTGHAMKMLDSWSGNVELSNGKTGAEQAKLFMHHSGRLDIVEYGKVLDLTSLGARRLLSDDSSVALITGDLNSVHVYGAEGDVNYTMLRGESGTTILEGSGTAASLSRITMHDLGGMTFESGSDAFTFDDVYQLIGGADGGGDSAALAREVEAARVARVDIELKHTQDVATLRSEMASLSGGTPVTIIPDQVVRGTSVGDKKALETTPTSVVVYGASGDAEYPMLTGDSGTTILAAQGDARVELDVAGELTLVSGVKRITLDQLLVLLDGTPSVAVPEGNAISNDANTAQVICNDDGTISYIINGNPTNPFIMDSLTSNTSLANVAVGDDTVTYTDKFSNETNLLRPSELGSVKNTVEKVISQAWDNGNGIHTLTLQLVNGGSISLVNDEIVMYSKGQRVDLSKGEQFGLKRSANEGYSYVGRVEGATNPESFSYMSGRWGFNDGAHAAIKLYDDGKVAFRQGHTETMLDSLLGGQASQLVSDGKVYAEQLPNNGYYRFGRTGITATLDFGINGWSLSDKDGNAKLAGGSAGMFCDNGEAGAAHAQIFLKSDGTIQMTEKGQIIDWRGGASTDVVNHPNILTSGGSNTVTIVDNNPTDANKSKVILTDTLVSIIRKGIPVLGQNTLYTRVYNPDGTRALHTGSFTSLYAKGWLGNGEYEGLKLEDGQWSLFAHVGSGNDPERPFGQGFFSARGDIRFRGHGLTPESNGSSSLGSSARPWAQVNCLGVNSINASTFRQGWTSYGSTDTKGTTYTKDIVVGSSRKFGFKEYGSRFQVFGGKYDRFTPKHDGQLYLGDSSYRWRKGYFVFNISESDERLKHDIGIREGLKYGYPDEWLDAWSHVNWTRFKMNDDEVFEDKYVGGIIAQDIIKAFESIGVDIESETHILKLEEYDDKPSRYNVCYQEIQSIENAYQRRRLDRIEAALGL